MTVPHATVLEHAFHYGLARGVIDIETMAQILRDASPAPEPLAPRPLLLPAVAWANAAWPEDVHAHDTLWLTGGGPALERLGPNEWSRGATVTEARELALAAAVLCAASLTIRERLFGDATVHELTTAQLALRLGVDGEALAQACADDPALWSRLAALAQQPFTPRLIARDLPPVSGRAAALWQDVLAALAEVDADHKPLAVWVAPLWVADIVSPYAREVRPLLTRWAAQQEDLSALAEKLAQGDEDAAYLCAELFASAHAEVRTEKESAEANAGVITLHDAEGRALGKIVDGARLDAGHLDRRLGDLSRLAPPAPIILLLASGEADVAYALRRLLCEVNAPFASVTICAEARTETLHSVAGARALDAAMRPLLLAAPADDVARAAGVALPHAAMAAALGMEASDDYVVVSEADLHQDALAEALMRGDFTEIPVVQRLWLAPSDSWDARHAHAADAIAIWQRLFGDARVAPEPDAPKPAVPARFRMRV
jgi:hypothetical protein